MSKKTMSNKEAKTWQRRTLLTQHPRRQHTQKPSNRIQRRARGEYASRSERETKRRSISKHQHRNFIVDSQMGAYKHRNPVCIHTSSNTHTNAHNYNIPTKISPHGTSNKHLLTKPPPHRLIAHKASTLVAQSTILPTLKSSQNVASHTPLSTAPARPISKTDQRSNVATNTHTSQQQIHKGKQNHLHSPNKHTHQKQPKDKQGTINKLTSNSTPSPPHAPPDTPFPEAP